jgi:hypothetical protein
MTQTSVSRHSSSFASPLRALSPEGLPTLYALNGLSDETFSKVSNALQLRTDLHAERVDVSHLGTGSGVAGFLLLEDDVELPIPPTPFAAADWDAAVVKGLTKNAVIAPVTGFLEAARKRRIPSFHAALWERQFFHRAAASIAAKRRASSWLLSMRGLVVRVPVSTSDDVGLARQCREADLRIAPFTGNGTADAHFSVVPKREARRLRWPAVCLEDLEAARCLTSGERRSLFSELFIDAISRFRMAAF